MADASLRVDREMSGDAYYMVYYRVLEYSSTRVESLEYQYQYEIVCIDFFLNKLSRFWRYSIIYKLAIISLSPRYDIVIISIVFIIVSIGRVRVLEYGKLTWVFDPRNYFIGFFINLLVLIVDS